VHGATTFRNKIVGVDPTEVLIKTEFDWDEKAQSESIGTTGTQFAGPVIEWDDQLGPVVRFVSTVREI